MDESVRAEAAKQITGNPVFEMVLAAMKEDVIAKWAQCPVNDSEGREWLWMFYQNTLKFEDTLKGFIATGKLAEYNREQEIRASKVQRVIQGAKTWLKN